MSNLKDTDFDDLFRRASDKYPLRTDSSDWDRMAAALERDPSPDPDDAGNPEKRRKKRFFWWFLLLPLAGIGYFVVHPSGNSSHRFASTTGKPAAAAGHPANPARENPAHENPADKNSTGNNTAGKATAGQRSPDGKAIKTTSDKTASDKTPSDKTLTGNNPAVNSTNTTPGAGNTDGAAAKTPALSSTKGRTPANVPPRSESNTSTRRGGRNGRHGAAITQNNIDNRFADDNTTLTSKHNPTTSRPNPTTSNPTTSRPDPAVAIDPATNPITAAFTLRYANINENRARLAGPYALNVNVTAPAVQKDSIKQKAKAKPYLYAGIIAAPDLSMVKFQSTKGTGFTYGVLIGYAFNDRWSIETGAYVDRKRYYTDGEYFNTSKVRLPPGSKLLNVDGTCYMWEIPLNVRYNFNPAGKIRWFATAGLSTYFMNREKYTYNAEYNGGWPWTSVWNKDSSSNYPFSIVGVSVGFEHRLGQIGNLRVEPYVRIPLGGIGTGNLPILSTGVNIGITRRLWGKK